MNQVSSKNLLLLIAPLVHLRFHCLHVAAHYRSLMPVLMAQHNCQILNWNVRGLNNGSRQDSVNELVRSTGATIVCL